MRKCKYRYKNNIRVTMDKICPDCGKHNLQEGMWFDYANQAEGETGNVIQPILYCCGCMYQENVD